MWYDYSYFVIELCVSRYSGAWCLVCELYTYAQPAGPQQMVSVHQSIRQIPFNEISPFHTQTRHG